MTIQINKIYCLTIDLKKMMQLVCNIRVTRSNQALE